MRPKRIFITTKNNNNWSKYLFGGGGEQLIIQMTMLLKCTTPMMTWKKLRDIREELSLYIYMCVCHSLKQTSAYYDDDEYLSLSKILVVPSQKKPLWSSSIPWMYSCGSSTVKTSASTSFLNFSKPLFNQTFCQLFDYLSLPISLFLFFLF